MDKKKILILNGGYSELPLIFAAKRNGLYVIVSGNNDSLPGNKYADEYIKCDYSDRDGILRIAKDKQVDYICSGCTDFSFFSTVYVCEKLKLPGHDSTETTCSLHHKNEFRKLLKKLSLPHPNFIEFDSKKLKNLLDSKDCSKKIFDMMKEFDSSSYIVKPVDMIGGIGIKKCGDLKELKRILTDYIEESKYSNLLIEEYIDGDNFGFTSIIKNKKVVFYMTDKEFHEYYEYAVSGTRVFSPSEYVVNSLKKQIESIANELNLVDGLFHLQYKINSKGIPIILEVMRRCPGDQYPFFVEYATGVDYGEIILKSECGFSFDSIYQEKNRLIARQVLICDKTGFVNGICLSKCFANNLIRINSYIPDYYIASNMLPKKLGILFLEFENEFDMESAMSNAKNNVSFDLTSKNSDEPVSVGGGNVGETVCHNNGDFFLFKNKPSDTNITLNSLSNSFKDIYIYGNGATSERVHRILKNAGFIIKGFVIDDNLLTEEQKRSGIKAISEILTLNVNIIIGFYLFGVAYKKIDSGFFIRNSVYFINRETLFNYDYYMENKRNFEDVLSFFEDELSIRTMYAYMDDRMNGYSKPLFDVYIPNQYFIDEITFGDSEVYVDCGMYDGDTIAEFISRCPNYKMIYGFEPDSNNILKFKNRKIEDSRIHVIEKGVFSQEGELRFSTGNSTASKADNHGQTIVEVTTIDSLYNENLPITFIKMDIEGSELEALKGAEKVIRNFMPKLAICVYHKKEDMISIPQLIKSFENEKIGYRFYLRHHSLHDHETVLYAIPFKK